MIQYKAFSARNVAIHLQDALEGMARLPDASFDLAIADPPYGASTKAKWQLGEHDLPEFGGAWKLASHTWDMLTGVKGFDFAVRWLGELKRLVGGPLPLLEELDRLLPSTVVARVSGP